METLKININENKNKNEIEEFEFDNFENELNENINNFGGTQSYEEKFAKFEIYFYFVFKDKEYIFPIKSDLFNVNTQYIHELIKNIVKKINEKNIIINYNNVKYIISLKDCEENDDEKDINFYIKNYELKPCKKKNFCPKTDFPSFSAKSLLKNIENKKISFITNTPLNIMIREKF